MRRSVPAAVALLLAAAIAAAQTPTALPLLTAPVNDFAGVIDAPSRERMDATIRQLQRATGDTIVVATVDDVAPYADVREYAVALFENRGRGVGARDRDNGLLVLLATQPRQVWIEVGYGLEPFITDGIAGETAREVMAPYFRQGQYGAGLAAGVERLARRIVQGRNVAFDAEPEADRDRRDRVTLPFGISPTLIFWIIVILVILFSNRGGRGRRRRRRGPFIWGMGPWSGWNSGVGSFGGGHFGGGLGGFGGGFGGFGGGRSGGGGGGASW
jgi:uncharacterized protein